MAESTAHTPPSELLEAFRHHYRSFEANVQQAVSNGSLDTAILWRLGDDLEQFTRLVQEVGINLSTFLSV